MSPVLVIAIAAALCLAGITSCVVIGNRLDDARDRRGDAAERAADMYVTVLRGTADGIVSVAVPRQMPMVPDDPPPADTAPLPVTACELAGQTVEQFVDAVFARHAGTVTPL